MRALLAVACLAACVEPSLDICGGLACPDGKLCRVRDGAAVCLLIADCTTKPDGVTCDPQTGQAGTCESGACVPIERCGNGVLETGEACDCGDDTVAPRSDCNDRNNSDTDSLAICRTSCALRTCGDGILDASELCEGEQLTDGLTCGSYGYYRGALACTNLCLVDQTGCDGRCGDGILDAQNEYCDSALDTPLASHCTDFGFSTGTLRCGGSCGPTFVDCRDALVFTELIPTRTDYVEIEPGPIPTQAWVALRDELLLYDERTQLTSIAKIMASHITDISSHGAFVAVSTYLDNRVLVYDASGLVATLTPPLSCKQVVMTSATRIACFGATTDVTWWDGNAWSTPIVGPTASDAIAIADGEVIFTSYAGGSSYQVNAHLATTTAITAMPGYSSTMESLNRLESGEPPTTAGLYGGLAYGGTGYGMVKLTDAGWDLVQGTDDYRHLATVGGRTMLTTSLYQTALSPRGRNTILDHTGPRCGRFVSTGGSSLCLTPPQGGVRRLYRFAGSSVSQALTPQSQLEDVYAGPDDYIYYVQANGTAVYTQPYSSFVAPALTAPNYWMRVISVRSSGAALVTGGFISPTILGYWTGTWDIVQLSQPIAAVTLATDVVVALSTGSGCTIHRGTPSNLVLVTQVSLCPRSLWVSPTGTIWGARPGAVRNISAGMDVMTLTSPPQTSVAVISGLDDNNIWVATASSIWYWNGATWKLQLESPGDVFDWLWVSPDGIVASSQGLFRTAWILDGHGSAQPRWNKLRLPSDPSAFIRPMIRPWGLVFLSQDGAIRHAVWQDDWP